jgi:hypothetical protein
MERGDAQVQVDIVGVDAALAELRDHRGIVVKIDAEGSECEILGALTPTLAEAIETLFVEIHDFAKCGSDDLRKVMHGLGFQPEETAEPTVTRFHR